jgi:hypothetical protein
MFALLRAPLHMRVSLSEIWFGTVKQCYVNYLFCKYKKFKNLLAGISCIKHNFSLLNQYITHVNKARAAQKANGTLLVFALGPLLLGRARVRTGRFADLATLQLIRYN